MKIYSKIQYMQIAIFDTSLLSSYQKYNNIFYI